MESEKGVSSAAGPPVRVLVIGDSGDVGAALVDADRLAVVESNTADDAGSLTDSGENLDCVVLVASGNDSLETLKAVRRTAPDLPVILVDDEEGPVPFERAVQAGAAEVVRMDGPTGWTDRLADRVRSLASGRSTGSDVNRWIDGLAGLSRCAISGWSLDDLMDEAVALVHDSVDATYTAIHEFNPEADTLRLAWGREWPESGTGSVTTEVRETNLIGYALAQGGPVIVEDFEAETPLDHSGVPVDDVAAAVTAGIGPPDDPFGVLGVYFTDSQANIVDIARFVGTVASVLAAVTDRHERQAELERYERIVETIDDGIYTLDGDFRITWVNQAAVSMLGYSRAELVGSHALMLTSEETIDEAARISQELLSGEREVGRLDTELRTAADEPLPIETQFTMLPLGDGRFGQVGVFRDITARKEYERRLTALHDSTRELVRAETAAEVGHIIQATATDLLALSTVVYRYDEANRLEPSAVSPTAERAFDGVGSVGPTDSSAAWQAFVDQETVTVGSPTGSTGGQGPRYFPLGTHGVFAATATDGAAFDTETSRLTGLLAANAEAALDRIDREEKLRERERERQRQNRRLKELNRVNEIIRGIDQTLVQAETREEIEHAVCEQLVRDDRYAFVWIGGPLLGRDEIVPQAWAGPENGYLDQVPITVAGDSAEPTGQAAATRETVVVSNVAAGFSEEPWRTAALSQGYQSVVSVPLAYGDLSYGVLSVYADEPAAFNDESEAVFSELGETIAYAINSLEAKQSLLTDRRVELDLRFSDEDELLVRMARAAACQLEFREFILQSGGESTVVFAAPVEATDRITGLDEQIVAIDDIRHLTDRDGTAVFEATLKTASVTSAIKEYGAVLRSIVASEHESRAVVELPRDADVRAFVETLQQTIPETELAGRRNRDRSTESQEEFHTDLESALTDRQLEVLRAAYRNGYFEWPRDQTGEEVAAGLDISQPTFNRHLRESERKLFTLLFEDRQ